MNFQMQGVQEYLGETEMASQAGAHRTQRDILKYAIEHSGIRYIEAKRLTGASSPNVCKVLRRLRTEGALKRVRRGCYEPTKNSEAVLQRFATKTEQLAEYFSSRRKGREVGIKELESLGVMESYAYRLVKKGVLERASPGRFTLAEAYRNVGNNGRKLLPYAELPQSLLRRRA